MKSHQIAGMIILSVRLERGHRLDGIRNLVFGRNNPELAGLLPQNQGVPNVVLDRVLHGSRIAGEGDDHIKHAQRAADLELPANRTILHRGHVAPVDGSNAVGPEPVQASARAPVQDDKRDDHEHGERDQKRLLKTAEDADHN